MEKQPTVSNGVCKAITSNASGQGGRPGPGGGGNPRPGRAIESQFLTASYFNAGTYVLSGQGLSITFLNNYQYATFIVYSSNISLNNEYTLAYNGTTVLSWTQTSNTTTIS